MEASWPAILSCPYGCGIAITLEADYPRICCPNCNRVILKPGIKVPEEIVIPSNEVKMEMWFHYLRRSGRSEIADALYAAEERGKISATQALQCLAILLDFPSAKPQTTHTPNPISTSLSEPV